MMEFTHQHEYCRETSTPIHISTLDLCRKFRKTAKKNYSSGSTTLKSQSRTLMTYYVTLRNYSIFVWPLILNYTPQNADYSKINHVVWSSYIIRWRQIWPASHIRFGKHGNSKNCKRAVTIHFRNAMVTYKHSRIFGHHTTTFGQAGTGVQHRWKKDKEILATYLIR